MTTKELESASGLELDDVVCQERLNLCSAGGDAEGPYQNHPAIATVGRFSAVIIEPETLTLGLGEKHR